MRQACEEHDIEATLTGLRASESGVRMFTRKSTRKPTVLTVG